MAVIGGRNVATNDIVIMASGLVMFIVSFLPWYGASFLGHSDSVSAWSAGFGAWFSCLLVLAVGGVVAFRVFGGRDLPALGNGAVSWAFVLTAVSILAAIIVLLRWLTYPSSSISGLNVGAKFGTYVGLIVAIVQAVFGYLSIVKAGEKLPWQKRTA
jgi:hypothetical protein